MKKPSTNLLLAALLAALVSAQSLAQTTAPLGTTYRFHLKNAPFPATSRAAGFEKDGKQFAAAVNYSDNTVVVYVPKNLPFAAKTDMVVHFHDLNTTADDAEKANRLIQQFTDAKRPAILVLPQGPKNAPDDDPGNFAQPNGFKNFITELLDSLGKTGRVTQPGNIVLSAHGGGYRAASNALNFGGMDDNIKETWLFDGLRGDLDKFEIFAKGPGRRLLIFWTKDGATKPNVDAFDRIMHERGTSFYAVLEESKLMKQWPWMPAGRVFQISVELPHEEIMRTSNLFYRMVNATPYFK